MANPYKDDGVDVAAGDDFSTYAGRICHDSFQNSPFVRVYDLSAGYFRGVRSFSFQKLPRGYSFDMTSDGNGTKVVLTAMSGAYSLAARDLLAMCGMDITRNGGLGLIFNNVLDVSSLGKPGTETHAAFVEMIVGLGKAAKILDLVLFRGETAELGVCVSSENPVSKVKFNWSGSMFGVYHRSKMITSNTLAPGMVIIALREKGFRANGISSVRKALTLRFGSEWWLNDKATPHIRAAAEPSALYDPLFHDLNGWHNEGFEQVLKVHSIIHLSGGAFKSKLGDDVLFPRGFSADLFDLWPPPQIMRDCAEWRGIDDEGIYKTWNGGQGALVIVSPDDVKDFICIACGYGIDAKVCGEVRQWDEPRIQIQSQFSGEEIEYRPETA